MALCDVILETEQYLQSLLNFKTQSPSSKEMSGYFERTGKLYHFLEKAHFVLNVRNNAWNGIDRNPRQLDALSMSLKNQFTPSDIGVERFAYFGQKVNYAELHYLSLISYIVPTWAVYDNLFNVIGRILSPKFSRQEDNPKLPELYRSSGENNFGIFLYKNTTSHFAWSCAFSYEIRNCLVHEGNSRDAHPLFLGNIIDDGFILSTVAKHYIENTVCKNYQDSHRDKNRFDTLWNKCDLLELLEYANGEIDALYEALLPYAVETLKKQIELFQNNGGYKTLVCTNN